MSEKMKILIAYDGSEFADNALNDMPRAGFPRKAEALVVNVQEKWLSSPSSYEIVGEIFGTSESTAAKPACPTTRKFITPALHLAFSKRDPLNMIPLQLLEFIMKILIAYDGSGTPRTLIRDLRISGLPEQADVFIISIAEIWLPPVTSQSKSNLSLDKDVSQYFQQHSEQISRNLAKTEEILLEAKTQLQNYFPLWNIQTDYNFIN